MRSRVLLERIWDRRIAAPLRRSRLRFAAAAALCAAHSLGFAAEPAEPAADTKHVVRRGQIKLKVEIDATVEASRAMPLKLEPKAWSDLTVREAVAHGARVKKGDVLIRLETDKIREQIDDLDQDQRTGRVGLELAEAELENLRQATPHRLEVAARLRRIAGEDYDYFVSTNRAQREKGTAFNLKSAEQRLEGVVEELKQLEKMYLADDLTEETEEIVLKRQRFAVEAARFSLESTRLQAQRELGTTLPREHESLAQQQREQALAQELAQHSLPAALARKTLEIEKLKRDRRKAEKKLAELRADQELLAMSAPTDGVVYYGACEQGKWVSGAALAKKLIPGGKLSANEVVLTIVSLDQLLLKASVSEADAGKLRAGLRGQAIPTIAPEQKLRVTLDSLGSVPAPGGGFEVAFSFARPAETGLMPGLTCRVSFPELLRTDVLVVPKRAVISEDGRSYVRVPSGNAKPVRKEVKTGDSDDTHTEIRDGLAERDVVLVKPGE